jgi:hypothetical protein
MEMKPASKGKAFSQMLERVNIYPTSNIYTGYVLRAVQQRPVVSLITGLNINLQDAPV